MVGRIVNSHAKRLGSFPTQFFPKAEERNYVECVADLRGVCTVYESAKKVVENVIVFGVIASKYNIQ